MTDIFDEVGEDLRRERMKRLWQSYGTWIIAAAVLIVLATAGWRGWETWQQGKANAAGDAFRAALTKASEGDHKAAAEALVAFSSDAPRDYAVLARLRAASENAAAGQVDTALSTFDATANDASLPKGIRDLAAVRAAMIAVDSDGLDQFKARVAPLDTPTGPWRHAARELLAVSAIKAQSWDAARAALTTLTTDPELPADFRQRAALLEDVLRAAVGDPPATAGAGS
jgi:hypothetical protein